MQTIQSIKLKDITSKIGSGATPRGGKNSYITEGIALIRSLNVYDFSFAYEGLAFIDEKQANQLENVLVERDDILLNITGASVCRCCLVPKNVLPARVNQHVSIVRIKPRAASAQYVVYAINSPYNKRRLLAIAQGGATREALTKEKIENFEIPLAPLPTQLKIAAILSAYDDLIENNLRRIKILEEMAQTLYREWFVKFRFPGHQKVKMVTSPLGKIPEGWEVSTVGDNITVVPRKNKIKTGDYLTEGVIPVIDQGKDFIAGYIDDTSLAYDGPLPIIVFGDHTCVLKWVDFRFAVGADGTQLIQPEYPEKIPPRFLFYTIQFVPLEQFGYQRHFKYLKEAKILIPSGNLARKFEEVVSSNTDLILNLQRQNLNLRQTRDLLLPKLISGQLDVSELDIRTAENGDG